MLLTTDDDETLFAFYQLLRLKPVVIVVLRSHVEHRQGGPTFEVREAETDCAMNVAGVEWEQWRYPDDDPDWRTVDREMRTAAFDADLVIAPAMEDGGHEHHNAIAAIARLMCAQTRIPLSQYLTYQRGHGRSDHGIPVEPTLAEWELKQQALACYASQAAFGPTAPWFGEDQREFVL